MSEIVYNYSRMKKPPEVIEEVGPFETMVNQGYMSTKLMIKRFREAGIRVGEYKKEQFDIEEDIGE